ncbi:uncharacterized protein LOC114941956 [Nylanderia fulva]|uniref:uncharacterized protein LOC114941956 n=1 Tax=Nylanderia fulva TaxID=613905 RepID=UPI0010FB0F7D|nr:uncharacterized protein LOC114941956 [Nylanderia fulva]
MPTVLLATAWVDIHTSEGRCFKVRALLDQGSNFSFISEALSQTLRTKRQRTDLQIKGFGEKYAGSARSRVSLNLTPCEKLNPVFPVTAYVFPRITSYATSRIRPIESWPHLQGLSLAYPDPSSRHQIHMLIGADVYGSLLLRDLRQGPYGAPTAQSTSFGWIISGPTGSKETTSQEVTVLNCVSALDVDSLLQKFWEDKEIPTPTSLTEEEEKCESHFAQTHSRDPDGRYVVRLLFKNALPIDIGESLSIARTLYGRLENKLNSKSDLCSLYRDFLTEYEALGHMTRVGESEPTENIPIYIPHHPVIREDSCTTKLRVVFNASCKTRNGTSLNDHLLIGPKLQQDLPAVLLRWRAWRLVYTADIARCFDKYAYIRGTSITKESLTYGLASAPYLSMRVLRQLALDEGAKFPAAVPIVNDSIYVDDALFGANDIDSLINTRTQLAELMRRGGFSLRKWASNCSELLDDLSSDQSDVTDHLILKDETLKILGLSWLPTEDSFRLTVKFNFPTALTKRSILSCIASLYDPLGWAAPVVINAKIILQELWLLHCDWDAPLPNELSQRWNAFASEFPQLESVRIPRWTGQSPDNLALEIHGFADASNRAYAAVVYLRVFHSLSEYRVSLIVAKSKVAPVKTVSIPRLELNAVVLLSRLVKWVIKSLNIIHCPIHCWTDSTIALAWLRQHPSKWTTYVANRVSEVQCNLPSAKWNHVPSKDNPADCASRGLYASKLVSHPLWWAGPPWLQWPSTAWPPHNIASPISTELTKQIHSESRKSTVLHVEGTPEWDLPYRYSSWTKLIRVTAYAYRFISRSAKQRNFEANVALSLNADELKRAEMFWVSYTQRKSFDIELKALKREENLLRKSPLKPLNPFIRKDSLLRFGGRLRNSALSFEEQHPILIPRGRVAELLIDQTHRSSLHGGTQLVLRTLCQKYWILSCPVFRRFVSRRGLPQKLYSDNSTNFHGADRELKTAFDKLTNDISLRATLANDRVEWHFIPAAAPHFSGLWEAGIKSKNALEKATKQMEG